MKALGTYFQNDPERPLVYGEVELINPPRRRLRGEELREGILVQPVIVGFCGTDHELMQMGRRGELTPKFPAGQKRLINGHEGVVWVLSQSRFAIVLIRGGDSVDPTRFTEDESYFEYGCDQADGPGLCGRESWPCPLPKRWYSRIPLPACCSSWSGWRTWAAPTCSAGRPGSGSAVWRRRGGTRPTRSLSAR